MPRRSQIPIPCAWLAAVGLAAGLVASPVAAGPAVNTQTFSDLLLEDTQVRDLAPQLAFVFHPDPFALAKYVYLVNVDAVSRLETGQAPRRGRVRLFVRCQGPAGSTQLAARTRRLDRNGNAWVAGTVPLGQCDFLTFEAAGTSGTQVVPAGASVQQRAAIEALDPNTDPVCLDGATLCLGNGRFAATLSWADGRGRRGRAVALPLGGPDGRFYFLDPNNWELAMKVIDGCAQNDHFWVFAGAVTDVAYTLTVTDTVSSESRTYENPIASPGLPLRDTEAFATCP